MNDESEASKEKPEIPKPEVDKPEAITPKSEVGALKREAFSFTGQAKEYFGIWIVNLFLTLITIGIYGAWAKVRRQRYFYGNTWLDGHNFEYHAKPKQILIGRIIVFCFLIIYNIIASVAPLWALIPFVIILIALPWLMNKAISFNARVSTYRNVQFGFEGSYGRAFYIYTLLPMIVPLVAAVIIFIHFLTSGAGSWQLYYIGYEDMIWLVVPFVFLAQLLVYPYISKLGAEYIGNRLKYGSAEFSTQVSLKNLYKLFGVTSLISLLPLVLIGYFSLNYYNQLGSNNVLYITLASYILVIVGLLFYQIGVRNIAYNGTKLDGKHQMLSSISRRKYVFIQMTNFLVVICTFGLMRPWAAIRLRSYIVDQTAIDVDGSLENIVAAHEPEGSVVAAEYFDIEGIDFGF